MKSGLYKMSQNLNGISVKEASNAVSTSNMVRFVITFFLCLLYSLTRDTPFSTITKPLPILFWLLVVISSGKNQYSKWLISSLFLALVGDIILDLGDEWLFFGIIPFLSSTAILAWAFQMRLMSNKNSSTIFRKGGVLLFVALPIILLFIVLISYSTDFIIVGAVLFILSILLLSNALSNLLYNETERTNHIKPIIGFIGACGIVANYLLYSIDLCIMPIQRDLVIQVYYWGTALVAWSFID